MNFVRMLRMGWVKGHRGLRARGGHARIVRAWIVRARAIAAMAVVLACSPAMRAAGLKDVSLDQFRADVTRLQSVVAGCEAAATATTCSADSVGDDELVSDRAMGAKGGFEEHWQWLRDALGKAKTAKADERTTLLKESEAQLEAMAQESATRSQESDGAAMEPQEFNRTRAAANAVLARAEFQRDGGPTWWERKKAQMLSWLFRLFEGVAMVGAAAPWLGTLLEWMFFVGAAVGLLFFLLRNIARQRLRVALGDTTLQTTAWDREAEDWAAWAEQHAAATEWREAVHCLYWAAIVSLEARRAWRHNPTRTPREYVRLLKPGSLQQQSLRGLTRIFERVWYGLREANAVEYAEARALYERLAGGAVETAETGAANGTLPVGGTA